jgi:hypothetical protein
MEGTLLCSREKKDIFGFTRVFGLSLLRCAITHFRPSFVLRRTIYRLRQQEGFAQMTNGQIIVILMDVVLGTFLFSRVTMGLSWFSTESSFQTYLNVIFGNSEMDKTDVFYITSLFDLICSEEGRG